MDIPSRVPLLAVDMAPSDMISKVAEGHHLKGHLGNLTPEQEHALVAFKDALTKTGLYAPATSTTEGAKETGASHDDMTLLCVASNAI